MNSETVSIDKHPVDFSFEKVGTIGRLCLDLVVEADHTVEIEGEYRIKPVDKFPDINGDSVIDIFDVVTLASHFGETLEDP